MLRYPDGGFLWLMAIGLSAEGWGVGTFIGPWLTHTFGTFRVGASLLLTATMVVLGIAGAYYFAKGVAWMLAHRSRPQP